MRLYIHTTPNTEIVPFNYQYALVGALHKWLGKNDYHDDLSIYSLSWLDEAKGSKNGLNFPHGASFFISSPNEALMQSIVTGMFSGDYIRWGMHIAEITLKKTPQFGTQKRFIAQSPILIKRQFEGERHDRYYFPGDPEANGFLTETLQRKLAHVNLPTDVSVAFDPNYKNPTPKMVKYRNLNIKATKCPVIVQGHPRAVQFAWEVGVGNSTGIGFGALR